MCGSLGCVTTNEISTARTNTRLTAGCRLKVSDFDQDGDEATLRLLEKGDLRRTIGLHFHAAQSISEYIQKAGITSGPLFRPRLGPKGQKLADRPLEPRHVPANRKLPFSVLPAAMKEATAPRRLHGPALHVVRLALNVLWFRGVTQ
jgi:integrase